MTRFPVAAMRTLALLAAGLVAVSCRHGARTGVSPASTGLSGAAVQPSVFWNAATVYFLLTDRFANGDPGNDRALGRARDGAVLRSYEGGDLAGLRRRIEAGYFDSLGVDAIWLTPFVEQVHGSVDEGTGRTYGYHGYWTLDWTALEPALGTREELRALVDAAHRHDIRVLMDAVINHTGPVTSLDEPWPEAWVRTTPLCSYRSYTTTVDCALVATLPDIRTESDAPVELPPALVAKWQREGRLDRERASLDAFFRRTGYPRAPRFYIIKWLTDWVREFGFDGYRVDTAKHFGESVSAELKREAELAFADWKRAHPQQVLDGLPFYMFGEVYGWDVGQGRQYDFGDRSVDFFAHGYDGLINFAFKAQAGGPLDSLFTRYATTLQAGALRGVAILNYVTSHDDGSPFDLERRRALDAGTRLLLAPGGAQIYYGDELARPLQVPGTQGDANLRSPMNWTDLAQGGRTAEVLEHWRKLGRFRRAHPAIGAGRHRQLQAAPYVFSRTLVATGLHDRVVVGLDQGPGAKTIPVSGVFADGTELVDAYSGEGATVSGGAVRLRTAFDVVLLAERRTETREGRAAPGTPVRVHVTNRSAATMDVYAVASGSSYRMGTVAPGMSGDFVVRQALLASGGLVEFIAEPSGGLRRANSNERISSGQLQLSPGSTVAFDIATQRGGSSATVRP